MIATFVAAALVCVWGVQGRAPQPQPLPALSMQLQRVQAEPGAKRSRRRVMYADGSPPELAPTFPGYGTHYAFVFVGTPPQRQSVIIDTGSHYTAFPCVGCSNCGKHTDPYFDLDKSSTESIPQCNGGTCTFSQSYAEGSSWHAYKVQDRLWVGGRTAQEVDRGSEYSVDYTFGCQTSETGLFKTQLENGIMGMSMGADSLANQLHSAGITESTVFGLCFSFEGGIVTMGGVDPSVHRDPAEPAQYAKLFRHGNWYGVKVLDMRLLKRDGEEEEIGDRADVAAAFTGGSMGTIVDSGTTDTYLPSALAGQFSSHFKSITGVSFKTNIKISLTEEQMGKFPDILYELERDGGGSIVVRMPWQNYVERIDGTDQFEFVLFFEEHNSAILGANFMDGHNVIFDEAGGRVGFAESDCDFYGLSTQSPTATPLVVPSAFPTPEPLMPPEWAPDGPCDAVCDEPQPAGPYSRQGSQPWLDRDDGVTTVNRTCTVHCSAENFVVFPSIQHSFEGNCSQGQWGACSQDCRQQLEAELPACDAAELGSRECLSGECPIQTGDYVVHVELAVCYPMRRWSPAVGDDLRAALADVFKVPVANIELGLNGSFGAQRGETFRVLALLRERAVPGEALAAAAAVGLASSDSGAFVAQVLHALNEVSIRSWDVDYSVYGWMQADDFRVTYIAGYQQPAEKLPGISPEEREGLDIALSIGIVICIVVAVWTYFCCRARMAPEEPFKLYSKVQTSDDEVELSALRGGRGVDLSDAQLDDSDVNSGRV